MVVGRKLLKEGVEMGSDSSRGVEREQEFLEIGDRHLLIFDSVVDRIKIRALLGKIDLKHIVDLFAFNVGKFQEVIDASGAFDGAVELEEMVGRDKDHEASVGRKSVQ